MSNKMDLSYRMEITDYLKSGENTVEIAEPVRGITVWSMMQIYLKRKENLDY